MYAGPAETEGTFLRIHNSGLNVDNEDLHGAVVRRQSRAKGANGPTRPSQGAAHLSGSWPVTNSGTITHTCRRSLVEMMSMEPWPGIIRIALKVPLALGALEGMKLVAPRPAIEPLE